MIFYLQIQIYFSQKLYIVLKVTTTYFNNLIGILVHVDLYIIEHSHTF
jgi:hypothetical protein